MQSSLSSTNAIPIFQVNAATIARHNPAEMGLLKVQSSLSSTNAIPICQVNAATIAITILLKWAWGLFFLGQCIIPFSSTNANPRCQVIAATVYVFV